MPDYENAQQSKLSDLDDADRYMLRSSAEIRAQLIGLARQPDIITAYFNGGKSYLLTAVLGVLDERGMVVLDFGPDVEITKKAIASGRLVCTTKHDGVPIRFTCDQLKSARFKSLPAIACTLPKDMYRMQRREFFRVTTPKINGPQCEITDPRSGKTYLLNICDISAGGVGMLTQECNLGLALQERYEGCRLRLPEHDEISVNIVIRNSFETSSPYGETIIHYGASFEGMSVADTTELQRYIFHLQTMQPK